MLTVKQRIANSVTVNQATGCWEWQGSKDRDGYGRIHLGGKSGRPYAAHRVAYEEHRGAIGSGLQIDHLCRVRNCVNPNHLEPVTLADNIRRTPQVSGPVCSHGHERTPENTYITPAGARQCRPCSRITKANWKTRKANGLVTSSTP